MPSLGLLRECLEVYDPEILPQASNKYQIVESCIFLSLRLLESPGGRTSLAQIGRDIVYFRNKSKTPHPYVNDIKQMESWITFFLGKMNQCFPTVTLDPKCAGEAYTIRFPGTNDMTKFNPATCTEMYLNRAMINSMLYCYQRGSNDNYRRLKFQMVITIAHEIVHVLTGLLSGEAASRTLTPPKIRLTGSVRGRWGEAGRRWEEIFLGGVVEFYYDESDSMGDMQAGEAFLFPDGRSDSRGWPVNAAYMNQFADGGKFILQRL